MNCTKWLALVAAIVVVSSTSAATRKGHLVEFHPISRKQYDSILGLTNGKPVISEARLISSGLKSLSELRSTISQDISSGWHQLLNITGLWPVSNKPSDEKVSGYPLCVIKTTDLVPVDEDDNHEHEDHDDHDDHHGHHGRSRSDDYRDISSYPAVVYKSYGVHGGQSTNHGHGNEHEHDHDHDHNHEPSPEHDNGNGSEYEKERPVINCIVVVKPKTPSPTQEPDKPHHTYPQQPPAHPSYYPPYPHYTTGGYPYAYPYHYPYQPVYRASPHANTARKTPARRRYKYRGAQAVDRSSPDSSEEEGDSETTNESKAIDYSQLYYQQLLNNLYQPQLSQPQPLPYGSPLTLNPYLQQSASNPSFALYNSLRSYGSPGGNSGASTGTPYSSSHGNSLAYPAGNNNIYAQLLALQQWQQLQRLQQNDRPHHSASSSSDNEDENFSGEEEH